MDTGRRCDEVFRSPVAAGVLVISCLKGSGHVQSGDRMHEGRIRWFIVRWTYAIDRWCE